MIAEVLLSALIICRLWRSTDIKMFTCTKALLSEVVVWYKLQKEHVDKPQLDVSLSV